MNVDPEDMQVVQMIETRLNDAVFGEMGEKGPNFRNVGWIGTTALMMKTQIGLGVLALPSVFDSVGLIPGVILLCAVAGVTTWSDYMVGVFKVKHRAVYGVDDVGQLIFGRVGKEVLAIAFMGLYVMSAGSAMLSLSICFNSISDHGACTAVFVAAAFILVFVLSSVRTLDRVGWLALIGVIGIITAVFTVTIAVGVQTQPESAPHDVEWKSDYKLFGNPTFSQGISAVSSLVFAFAGTGAFFPIVAEMRDPRLYPRALAVCQTLITVVYLVVGIVVYYYCGSYVASPALGSAGKTMKKIAYGIALPGLLASGILMAHVSSNAIPVFNGIVSLAGALFGTLLCFQPMGCMWLYDNWSRGKDAPTLRWRLMVGWSIFVIVSGTFLMIAGTYGAIVGIIDSHAANGGTSAWSCADNSNSS
ncbi:Amino acid transporter, transmembrane [Cordyceps fumosorosea ARSEF 2679]|uniref:Amino acid transporter, transmembrane n=1 Tax=Cordyceps fumosorosea (strain ARSEF 2679) TaxID=1081104 RepID=A0A167PZN3_CORFA|nr:Amino acid transporter, transmembrane [Cordyceps fumosorosea ARSEF 2679]OAA57160.1 Amino acid transporter, transmembrane [Cordyceps fumosorosea ARSEF 2679]